VVERFSVALATQTKAMRKLLSLALLFALNSCTNNKVDLIVHHAMIYTVDSSFTVAEAMAVKDGKIVAVGTNDEIQKKYTAAENVDAAGAAVYPGLIDAHAHFVGYGTSLFHG
jgi:predicted amidohydrolase YtcJ